MNQDTQAIILHTTDYSTSSLIVKAYTREYGAQSYIARGVRTARSRMQKNHFQPLSLVELVATRKPGADLGAITEVRTAPPFTTIPFDLSKSTMAIFLAEVLYRSVKEEERNETLFDFIHTSILLLDSEAENFKNFHIAFLVQLSKHLGIYPSETPGLDKAYFDLREGVFCESLPGHPDHTSARTAFLLNEFIKSGFRGYRQVDLNKDEQRDVLSAMIFLYEYHQTHGARIRSRAVLQEVLH